VRADLRAEDVAAVFEQARARGRAEGVAEAAAAFGETLRARRSALDHSEDELAALAIELAGYLVGYELEHAPAAFPALVCRALKMVAGEADVTVRVNPRDMLSLDEFAAALDDAAGGAVRFIGDDNVPERSARVDTGRGRIDCDLDLQLDALAERMGVERWQGELLKGTDPEAESE
jgi:flagellar biosynthesis/type III secretory pathway protein FliH